MKIDDLYTKHNISGSIVVSTINRGICTFNPDRAHERLTPASTFKILNTLIALEEKVISELDEVIKWDGYSHKYPSWNCDQTLET